MKKFVVLFLTLAAVISVVGCGPKEDDSPPVVNPNASAQPLGQGAASPGGSAPKSAEAAAPNSQ